TVNAEHKWDAGTITTEPTYTSDGVRTYICTVCGATKTEAVPMLIDSTLPIGEIKISTNSFKSFINTITFGLFFKENQTVTIIADDKEIGLDSVSYYVSENPLTLEEVKALSSWTLGTKTDLKADFKGVVYAKIADKSGNILYISSDGIVVDSTVPVISGVENGKEYCKNATITVTENYLESVTVDGKKVTLDGKNQFTLLPKADAQKIVVTDKAGNVATLSVTVNAEHKWDAGTITTEPTAEKTGVIIYKCSVCSETKSEDVPKLAPSIISGQDGKYQKGTKSTLLFASNATLEDFLNASVDGNVVDKNDYMLKTGSTIVELTTEYLDNLSVGKHTLSIKSTTGTATADFIIIEKEPEKVVEPEKEIKPEIPKTSNSKFSSLWISLMLVSGSALAALEIGKKRRKLDEK
ncbi:MAG: hypothetical protein RR552_04650, partial [Oscillospiraceae bacterium]